PRRLRGRVGFRGRLRLRGNARDKPCRSADNQGGCQHSSSSRHVWSPARVTLSCLGCRAGEYRGSKMPSSRKIRSTALAVLLTVAAAGMAEGQTPARSAPTAADWAALPKLPDFTGVWEVSFGPPGGRGAGGGGGRGARAGGPPAGPQLTPAYAAK